MSRRPVFASDIFIGELHFERTDGPIEFHHPVASGLSQTRAFEDFAAFDQWITRQLGCYAIFEVE